MKHIGNKYVRLGAAALMKDGLEVTEDFELDVSVKNKGTLNTYKHMLMQKKVTTSPIRNFLMIVYFFCYRTSVEFGLCELTRAELAVVMVVLGMILFSLVNQGSRCVCFILRWAAGVALELFWIYCHIDEIREMRRKNPKYM